MQGRSMNDAAEISSRFTDLLGGISDSIVTHLPGILSALLLLLAGWLLARLVHGITTRALQALNRLLERFLSGRPRAALRFSTAAAHLLANVLFWVTLFVFATLALRSAGLQGIASWLERIVEYLPAILSGALIIFIGYIASSIVRDTVYTTAHSAEVAEAELLSRLAWAITMIMTLIIGLDQANVDITVITIMLAVTTGTLLAGFALAFGLGARTLVSNLIAAHYLKEMIEPGQKIRVGNREGKVLDVSATAVIIESPEGRTSIPAGLCQKQAVSVLLAELDDE